MSPAPDESLKRAERLSRSAEYQHCYRSGRRLYGTAVNLHFRESENGGPRLGITASRKVGKSVVRHRLKRQIREVFRRWPHRRQLPAVDLVIHLKPGAGDLSFRQVRSEVEGLLGRLRSGPRRGPRGRRGKGHDS
ncbi:MAG: ribonuclease P protein component [Acidobacteria bacterium]|nr:ribonuclease P protein component [Acidobacteriota bacterium]